ncbi:MAG: 7-cyano-7-deazaguanine synthase [Candidatus Vogelbacteria bacterium]|nr:7-cyano-7-deazaguanine synthase [Candidatus Vogelbacteria bacterium]
MESVKKTLVLFSGGRDSSAAAVEMIRSGYFIKLFTYQTGPELAGPFGDSAPSIRHRELTKVFPQKIDPERVLTGNMYLVKKLAIDKTNSTHVVYPIALTLSFLSGAILYCLENGINDITCGYSGYQAKEDRYIEQHDDFFDLTKLFLKEYGLDYHAPIIKKTKQEVMDILEQCGISSNSLEVKSIFGAVPFEVDKALEYWNEAVPVCREHIARMRSLNTSLQY